jgi:hypothetical protein
MVNLGHVYRKQRRWPQAVAAYERALALCAGQPGTYAALGYTHHLQARACMCWVRFLGGRSGRASMRLKSVLHWRHAWSRMTRQEMRPSSVVGMGLYGPRRRR